MRVGEKYNGSTKEGVLYSGFYGNSCGLPDVASEDARQRESDEGSESRDEDTRDPVLGSEKNEGDLM